MTQINQNTIVVDESSFPIRIVRYYGSPSQESVDQYFGRADNLLMEQLAYVTISNLNEIEPRKAQYLMKKSEEWVRMNRAMHRYCHKAMLLVASNPVVRVALRAYMRFNPAETEVYQVFQTEEMALAKAQTIVGAWPEHARNGLPRPSRLRT